MPSSRSACRKLSGFRIIDPCLAYPDGILNCLQNRHYTHNLTTQPCESSANRVANCLAPSMPQIDSDGPFRAWF
jgi:hypothetical protein